MKSLIFPLLIVVLTGCGFLPDIRLNRDATPSEIIGLWTLTEDSLQDIKTDNEAASISGDHKIYNIRINKDGTLRYHSLLQMPTQVVDLEGTWKLQSLSNKTEGNNLQIVLNAKGGYALSLDFTEDNGKLRLFTYFGDPDSWRLEVYERNSEQGAAANP